MRSIPAHLAAIAVIQFVIFERSIRYVICSRPPQILSGRKTTYEVLKGVSLAVNEGEFVAVMGPSGSGKTTLLNCISCYIPADSGSITLRGEELARLDEDALAQVRNRKLGFVFQDFLLLDG